MIKHQFIKRGLVLISLGLLMAFSSCKDSPTASNAAQVSLSVKYLSASRAASLSATAAQASAAAVDSIQITRARLVVSNIEFEGGDEQNEDDDLEFRTPPMVIELNLTGSVQSLMLANVPYGSYPEIEIQIRGVTDADLANLSPADRALFADFVAGGRYSVIIEGLVYPTGADPQPFVFRSGIIAEQEYELNPPLVVSANNPAANITMVVDASWWFVGPGGALLDPNDAANQSAIAQNIKKSINMYGDDDGDGDDDDDDDDDGDD